MGFTKGNLQERGNGLLYVGGSGTIVSHEDPRLWSLYGAS